MAILLQDHFLQAVMCEPLLRRPLLYCDSLMGFLHHVGSFGFCFSESRPGFKVIELAIDHGFSSSSGVVAATKAGSERSWLDRYLDTAASIRRKTAQPLLLLGIGGQITAYISVCPDWSLESTTGGTVSLNEPSAETKFIPIYLSRTLVIQPLSFRSIEITKCQVFSQWTLEVFAPVTSPNTRQIADPTFTR